MHIKDSNSENFASANSYPCNTGIIINDPQSKVSIGYSYSHSVLC